MQNNPFGHLLPQQRPAAQPMGDPIVAPAPPSERRAQEDQAMQRQRFELDRQRFQADLAKQNEPDKAPSGYRYTADGNLEPIPGGPATASREGGAIPVSAATVAREYVGQYTDLERALNTFQDDFAGNLVGGLENTTEAYFGIGTPGQSEWWADFRATDNLIRNSLFGASLTQGEKSAYNATTITPGMRPDKVRANLQRRAEIVRNALAREKEFYLANGYKPEAVDALFSPLRERPSEQTAATPPAFQPDEQDGAAMVLPRAGGGDGGNMPDLRPGGGLDSGDSNETMGVVTDSVRREDNPVLAGVRAEYARRLGEGQSAEEIIKWARSVGIDPSAYRSIQEQVRFRNENPNVPIEQYDTTQLDDRVVPISGFEQAMGTAASSPLGTFIVGAGDAATAFTLDEIAGAVGGNTDRARLAMGAIADRNPVASTLGNIAGGVGTALVGEAGLGAAGLRAGIGRAMAADTAFGAAAGAGGAQEGQRLQGAAMGAGAAAVGSYAGQRVGNALSAGARGTASNAVNRLREAGVTDMTVGQVAGGRVGQAVRSVEDRLSGVPVIGDMVNDRRRAGLRQFNQAAFKKVLEPIGGDVGDRVGQDAIEEAQRQVSKAFSNALAGKGAVPDEAFERDLTAAVMGVGSIKRLGEEVRDEIGDILAPYADEAMLSGEALDDISRSLRTLKTAYARDPLGNRVGKQIDRVERAVFDLFDRQASGTIPEYMKARQAYRRLSVVEDAVLKAQNQPDNVFTAAQLGQADKANTKKFGGKRAAARGDMPFNDLQQAGQEVLPNRVPDSGTAGRLIVPLVALGAGGGADASGATNGGGLTIGAILAGLYSRTGQRILTKPSRGVNNQAARRLLGNSNTTRAIGAAGGATGAALTNQP